MTLSELLSEALGGDEPTELNIWKKTRAPGASVKLAEELLILYADSSTQLDPIPLKRPREFRPAFLADYSGRSDSPYDREFRFVDRALLYADAVVVEDELAGWLERDQTGPDQLRFDWALGFEDCDNATWAARRIARYAQLEQGKPEHGQLLYYTAPPSFKSRAEVEALLDWEAVRSLGTLVVDRRGYMPHLADNPVVVLPDLIMWFQQFLGLLDHAGDYCELFDLYLPSWFAGPELLEWWWQQVDRDPWVPDKEVLQHHQRLTRLLLLPAPSARQLRNMTNRELLSIRSADELEVWRQDIGDALETLSTSPGLFKTTGFELLLDDRLKKLNQRLDRRPSLKPKLSDLVVTGIASGAVAEAMGQAVTAAVAGGVAPIVLKLMASIARWFGARSGPTEALVRQYQLFMDGNMRHPSGALIHDKAPSSFATELGRGRPIDLDF